MAGPQREWHSGDKGPSAWNQREMKPFATHTCGWAKPAFIIEHGFRHGRDPYDKVTLELPLDGGPDIDDRVLALVGNAHGDLTVYAEAALFLGYHYLCWLYLMEREL